MSVVADAKKNWLEQVKIEAEALTRERLAKSLPKLQEVADNITATSVPTEPSSTKKGK